MLVALEAMKDYVSGISHDISRIDSSNAEHAHRISSNEKDIYDNVTAASGPEVYEAQQRIEHLQDACAAAEYELVDNRNALVLYCQQFAFASYMVAPCAEILSCKDRKLNYRYAFSGDYHSHYDVHDHHYDVHDHVDDHSHSDYIPDDHSHSDYIPDNHSHSDYIPDDHMHSSHGYELNVTGGNTPVAPGTHPELAAAAVNPYEAVIQVNGETIIAPMSEINPNSVELACDDTGCVLIPDDGIASNDLIPHAPAPPQYDDQHHDPYAASPYDDHHDDHYHEPVPSYDDHHYDHDIHAPVYDNTSDNQMYSSHGYKLNMTGGGIEVAPGTHPELAAAAVSPTEAVIQYNGESIIAPMDTIDYEAVELARDHTGYALIPDDGIAANDVAVPMSGNHYLDMPYGANEPIPFYDEPSYFMEANDGSYNTHGIDLPEVGGYGDCPMGTNAELAAASVSETTAVIVHDGQAFHAPIDKINPEAVELACNMDGCALIQDDGNPDNDVYVEGM